MYELIHDPITSELVGIRRMSDGAFIPLDHGNRDYQDYLASVGK